MTDVTWPKTANEQLKDRFQSVLGTSLIAAVVGHLLVFQLFPEMTAEGRDDIAKAISSRPHFVEVTGRGAKSLQTRGTDVKEPFRTPAPRGGHLTQLPVNEVLRLEPS